MALNPMVTTLLNDLLHPLRTEIETLRQIIIDADLSLTENVKWNGPNYCFDHQDRITMKINPPKNIQLILHRGAKVLDQPKDKLIQTDLKLLTWKENDRAVITFKDKADIEAHRDTLKKIIKDWIKATA